MGKFKGSPSPTSDPRQCERILKSLVEMLQSHQSEIETLADDRKFLEQYIHIQHDFWSSRVRLLESNISQIKKDDAKYRKIQADKLELMVGIKQREVSCYKKHYELAETDIEDFRSCVETLSADLLELKEKLGPGEAGKSSNGASDLRSVENSKEKDHCTAALKVEMKKLKHDYKMLSSKKEAEISALLSEKDFVWYQLKKMESDYIAILKSKNEEIQYANETIGKLQSDLLEMQTSVNEKNEMIAGLKSTYELDMRRHTEEAEHASENNRQLKLEMEELRSLTKEKDETIAKLKSDLVKLEKDVQNSNIGKSRFSKERHKDALTTPSTSNAKKVSRKRISQSATANANQKRIRVDDGSAKSQASAPVHRLVRCSSRQRTKSDLSAERPVLFHANFKVPKLKKSPPVVITQ